MTWTNGAGTTGTNGPGTNGAGVNFEAHSFDDQPPPLKLIPVTAEDLFDIPPRRWLYGTTFLSGSAAVVAGRGGTGKTAWAMVVALSIATGRQLLEGKPHRSCKVCIYNLEDGRDELRRRLAAVVGHYNIPKEKIVGNVFLNSGLDRKLVVAMVGPGGAKVVTPDADALIAEIKENDIGLVVVDPFIKAHQLTENDNNDVEFAFNEFARVAHATGCLVLLVHHARKGGGGTIDDLRGGGAIVDAARPALMLSTMTVEEAKALGVADEKRRFYFKLSDAKVNMSPPLEKTSWYELVGVRLSNGTDEYPDGDNVQTVKTWTPPTLFEGLSQAEINSIFKNIDDGFDGDGVYSRNKQAGARWVGHTIIREAAQQISDKRAENIIEAWLKSGALKEFEYTKSDRKKAKGIGVGFRPGGWCPNHGNDA